MFNDKSHSILGGSVRIDGYNLQASSYESADKMFSVCAPFESGRPVSLPDSYCYSLGFIRSYYTRTSQGYKMSTTKISTERGILFHF